MSDNCTHDCSTCGENCAERENTIQKDELNEFSSVKKVYGIVSGKGGVGKSLVTSLLACETARSGKKTAILDADITGPSVPKAFGLSTRAFSDGRGILPVETRLGIDVMSINLLLENETDPVVWRGPIIAGTVKQFWTDVIWEHEDIMFIDMPPGTGDVPLTVFQSIPVDGIIVVTSPQDLVSMIVEKAVNMAKMMNIPVYGVVENMSYFTCPDCGKKHFIYGESKLEQIASRFGITNTARIPIDPEAARLVDAGKIEEYPIRPLEDFAKGL